MTAAFFNQLADRQKAAAVSAGTEPGLRDHPEVLAVMQEVGIDISKAKPQKLTGSWQVTHNSSLRWAAATSAHICLVCVETTGRSEIQRGNRWMKSARSEMKLAPECNRSLAKKVSASWDEALHRRGASFD
jgi:protein-tyrosine-phosphatase